MKRWDIPSLLQEVPNSIAQVPTWKEASEPGDFGENEVAVVECYGLGL